MVHVGAWSEDVDLILQESLVVHLGEVHDVDPEVPQEVSGELVQVGVQGCLSGGSGREKECPAGTLVVSPSFTSFSREKPT